MRMAGLALSGRAKHGGDIVVTLDVGLRCEVQVAAIGLRFTCKRITQILFGLRAFELHTSLLNSL